MADNDTKYSAAAHTQAAVDVADFLEDSNEEVVEEQAKVVGVTTSNAKVEEDASVAEQDAEATMMEEAQAVQRKEVEEAAEAKKKVEELNHTAEQERLATKRAKAEEEEATKAAAKELAIVKTKAGFDLSLSLSHACVRAFSCSALTRTHNLTPSRVNTCTRTKHVHTQTYTSTNTNIFLKRFHNDTLHCRLRHTTTHYNTLQHFQQILQAPVILLV